MLSNMQYEIKTPMVATDILIKYQGKLVLIKRKNYPCGIAIPGGFAEYGLSLEENAAKEAKEETGLDIKIEYLLGVYSNPQRDPRGHMVSVTYVARGYGELRAGDDAKEAGLYTQDEMIKLIRKNQLVFDHAKILTDFLDNEKRKNR